MHNAGSCSEPIKEIQIQIRQRKNQKNVQSALSTLYKARLHRSALLQQKRVWEVLGMLLGDVMCHIDNSIATSQVPYCSLSRCEQHHTPIYNEDFLSLNDCDA